MVTNHVYRTSDTPLATYLVISGFPLQSVDYSGIRYNFEFARSPDVEAHASLYITGKALCDPMAFDRVNRKLLRIIRKQIQWCDD